MTKEEILTQLKEKGLTDIIELVEDAEAGELEELELVESIGLVHDGELNREVIMLLQQMGVKIIYINFDEDEAEDENE